MEAAELLAANEILISQGMEEAKIVESIGTMAEVISQIADQVNLLFLNASILVTKYKLCFTLIRYEIKTDS